MTQGERIKHIRVKRGMTQQQLGEACGFAEGSAGVRIRQYESNSKSPKSDILLRLAEALKIHYLAIKNYDLGCAEDIIETLFWLDANGKTIDLFPMAKEYDTESDWRVKGQYNDYEYMSSKAPVGMVIRYGLVNDFMGEWCYRKQQLNRKEITPIQYDNWKWNWPLSCDDMKYSYDYVDWMNLS